MSANLLLGFLLATPLLQAALVSVFARPPGLRDVLHISLALAQLGFAGALAADLMHGARGQLILAHPLPDVDLKFAVEPLGALIACVVAGLGALQAAFTSGFVRSIRMPNPSRLMAFSSLSVGAALAVALSGNLFTLFVAYQALILTSSPLVGDREGAEGKSARAYLASLLGPSLGLFLPAMVWIYTISGPSDFRVGGMLGDLADPITANVLLMLFVFGVAMTAIPPFGGWVSAVSGSSYPALMSIYAIAVLPAGCVTILKIAAYVFGPALNEAVIASRALLALAGVGMCAAALLALSRQDIRERIAFSCVAQALAAVVGALLALPAGLFASSLQIVAASSAAATLLMAAGATSVVTGRQSVEQYPGLGRIMPWTFAGFAIASASMIGMPPFAGAWAKLWLITAAAGAGLIWAAVLVGSAAMLTFAHLGPLAANAFATSAPVDAFKRPDGASILLAAPIVVAAVATLGLLVLADPLATFLSPIWTPPS